VALPRIGITLGDPAGIGPEVLARTLSSGQLSAFCTPVVIGDARVVEQAMNQVGGLAVYQPVGTLPGELVEGRCYLLDLHNIAPNEFLVGEVSAAAGRAAGQYVERAVSLAQAEEIDAVVTGPIDREAFTRGGYGERYRGQAEMLASLNRARRTCAMLVQGELRVCLVTNHVTLLEAITAKITQQRILGVIELAHDACARLGILSPAIGVAGLNPHAGEGGLFDNEELREIAPAVQTAQSEGFDAHGPFPAAALFRRALAGEFHAVVAMHHDQGQIAVALAGLASVDADAAAAPCAVSVTLGLPFVCTAADQGAALDQASAGDADHRGLVEAIRYAARLCAGARSQCGATPGGGAPGEVE